jgi:hypothetical protein
VRRERESRKEAYLSALERLALRCRERAEPEAEARYLRKIVGARPRLESAWSDLMAALIASGERLEAMEVYARYKEFLNRAGKGRLLPPAAMTEMYDRLHILPPARTSPVDETNEPAADLSLPEAAGGAVPLNSPYYVDRPADSELAQAVLQRHSIVLVQGPRKIGKTSLVARGLDRARSAGAQVFLTDARKLTTVEIENIDTFFRAIAGMFADQREGLASPAKTWDPERAPSTNFERYVRREVLGRIEGPVVWGFDEADRLFHYAYKDDVFGLLRAWHNDRSLDPHGPWSRLTLVMSYATEARLFISDLNQSPFNVGTRVSLEDFTLQQVEELFRRHGLDPGNDAARLYALVGGHPFLVRCSLHAMKTRGLTIQDIETTADEDGGLFGAHLQTLLLAVSRDAGMAEEIRSLLHAGTPTGPDVLLRLRSAGVLTGRSPQSARIRCRLYESYLKRRLA